MQQFNFFQNLMVMHGVALPVTSNSIPFTTEERIFHLTYVHT